MPIDAASFPTPGKLLTALLKERGWTTQTLSDVLGVSVPLVTRIRTDNRRINADLALMLEEVFGIDANVFLTVQQRYDLARAQITRVADEERKSRAQLYNMLPISEMMKRGWLNVEDSRNNSKQVEAAVIQFFGVKSVGEIGSMPHAAKKTEIATPANATQVAWLYRAKQIAEDMLVPAYEPQTVRATMSKLRDLLFSEYEVRNVPRILAESGIRFVIVQSLSSGKIDGACFWLDDSAPVIAMSLRFDRIDNFWFVLRHELEHMLRGHGAGAAILDIELEGERARTGLSISEEERQANYAAAQFCVPEDKLQRFIDRKSPFFSERDIIGFARTMQVHPGLVAGQLQWHTERYDRFRKHQVKIRSIVAPGAMVDGWGDVAPVDF